MTDITSISMIVAQILRSQFVLVCACCALLLLAQGCASGSGNTEKTNNPSRVGVVGDIPRGTVGWVVRVNEDGGYVVVEGQHLPGPGSQGKVFREELLVGMIRFDRFREAHFGIADILTGFIQTGDRVVY